MEGLEYDKGVFRYRKVDSTHKQASKSKPILYTTNDKGCFLVFSHHRDKDGYVRVIRRSGGKKRMHYLHRLAYETEIGKIPDGKIIMHSCDNPSCINVEHLSIGTHADNQRDMTLKGRCRSGEVNGRAKLTNQKVISIRNDTRDALTISKEYGVTRTTIYQILNRETWKHI